MNGCRVITGWIMDIWLNGGWIDLLALAAAVGCGLTAGLFFVFPNAILRALSKLENERGMAAMQAINAVILNPPFQQPGTAWPLSGNPSLNFSIKWPVFAKPPR